MRTLSLSPLSRLASLAPLAVRLITGIIILAHGWQKLTEMGPGNLGGQMLAGLGVPLPMFMGYVVTFRDHWRPPANRRVPLAARRSPAHHQPGRRDSARQG
jgi:hypothetical protein